MLWHSVAGSNNQLLAPKSPMISQARIQSCNLPCRADCLMGITGISGIEMRIWLGKRGAELGVELKIQIQTQIHTQISKSRPQFADATMPALHAGPAATEAGSEEGVTLAVNPHAEDPHLEQPVLDPRLHTWNSQHLTPGVVSTDGVV